MSKPQRDGRPMLERARELARLSPWQAHERSGELLEALRMAMDVIDVVARGDDCGDQLDRMRVAFHTFKPKTKRRRRT